MTGFSRKTSRNTNSEQAASEAAADALAKLNSLSKSQAVIEFGLDGKVITANPRFLDVMGYSLDEVQGRHHRMFVEPVTAQSDEYRTFWAALERGEYRAGQFKRVAKDGREVWLGASYNPVVDAEGKLYKIIEFATDITEQKADYADLRGQVEAINRSHAVVEFQMDGTIIKANPTFLHVMGYSLDEIVGKHHSMFVDKTLAQSSEYQAFWAKLRRGEFQSAQYKRIGKGGKEVWIEATYHPILDANGKPFKVVKHLTDVTAHKAEFNDLRGQIEAINRWQGVIQFNMDGTIITANRRFLEMMGYSLEEIRGKHHSMFALPGVEKSAEYREFWASLTRGEGQAHRYNRVGKGGKEVWLDASYNPIFDLNGKPFKVVKYATDLTDRKRATSEMADQFETSVKSLVASVMKSAGDVREEAESLAAAAEQANNQSAMVASATEELTASIAEISRQVSEASQIASRAVNETTEFRAHRGRSGGRRGKDRRCHPDDQ